MKKLTKYALLFLSIILILMNIVSCNGKAKTTTSKKSEVKNKQANQEPKKSEIEIDSNNNLKNKKIVIIKDIENLELNKALEDMENYYVKNGCDKNNFLIFRTPDELKDVNAVIAKIKAFKPDVINLMIGVPGPFRAAISALGIPVIVGSVAEIDCDQNGVPRGNVTGFKAVPTNLPTKLYKMLNNISPIGNKKAVFINAKDGLMYNPDLIKNALKACDVELKEFTPVGTSEEFIAAAEKYAKDDEIGWVLLGVPPSYDSKGSRVDFTFLAKKLNEITNKPIASYYEIIVASGALCGMALDDRQTFGTEPAEMTIDFLKGKNIKDLKMRDHTHVNIILNLKTAEKLKVKFPDDLTTSAYRIYKDYDFNYIGEKK